MQKFTSMKPFNLFTLLAFILFAISCQKHPIEDEIALAQALAASIESDTDSSTDSSDDSSDDSASDNDSSDDDSSSDDSTSDDDSSDDSSDSSDDNSTNDSTSDNDSSSDDNDSSSDSDSSSDQNNLSATVQGKINDYIAANYPGSSIEDIDVDSNEIDVKLNSGVELIFDLNGNFLRLDN